MHRRFLFAIPMSALVVSAFVAGQQTATRRIPEFENDHVRVWKSLIAPKQPLAMHRHDQPRVLVALKGGTVKIVQESGESKTVTWEPGRAYWLPADPPGHRHADVNEGNETIEVIVVELGPSLLDRGRIDSPRSVASARANQGWLAARRLVR